MAKTKAELAAAQWEWRRKNPERARAYGRKNYRKNGAHPSAKMARRRYHLKITYGISLEQYEEMFVAQGGVCKICSRPETNIKRGSCKSLDVDHDHQTGEVRGLLCSACNSAFGLLGEDPERILALFDYAVEHNGN